MNYIYNYINNFRKGQGLSRLFEGNLLECNIKIPSIPLFLRCLLLTAE